jgi:hypothetical protein
LLEQVTGVVGMPNAVAQYGVGGLVGHPYLPCQVIQGWGPTWTAPCDRLRTAPRLGPTLSCAIAHAILPKLRVAYRLNFGGSEQPHRGMRWGNVPDGREPVSQ